MATVSQLVTAADLLEMPPGEPCELIAGEVRTMTPAGGEHCYLANRLAVLMTNFAEKERLGWVFSGEPGFQIAHHPDTVRAPDVAFVRRERLARPQAGFIQGPPDLAVEVASPYDRPHELREKTQVWLDAGASLVWVVWPGTRSVTVHRPGAAQQILHEGDTLSGEDVLSGFACPVADIFRT